MAHEWLVVAVLAAAAAAAGCGGDDDDGADAAVDARVVDGAPPDGPPADAAPGLAWTSTSHDYGMIPPGGMTGNQWVVRNDGAVSSGPINIQITGPDAVDFNFGFNTCQNMMLTPGASCNMAVRFSPMNGRGFGPRTAFLDASATPGGSVRATMTATVVMPPTLLTMPSTLFFAPVQVGQTSGQMDIIVRNQSAGTVTALSISVTGNSADFPQATSGTLPCSAGQSLAPATECHVA